MHNQSDVDAAVRRAVQELASTRQWGSANFVSLPMFGPDGSPVTVRVTGDTAGFRVDDAGLTYRDLKRLGLERGFSKAGSRIGERLEVTVADQMVSTAASADDLARAISDVGLTTWQILEHVYSRLGDVDEDELEEGLRERLAQLPNARLDESKAIAGGSTTVWQVSAIVHFGGRDAVFQAVGDHAQSIYRASAAFHDLAQLPDPPRLVSVVKSKAALGPRLGILSQAGRVIEQGQDNAVYMRAAA